MGGKSQGQHEQLGNEVQLARRTRDELDQVGRVDRGERWVCDIGHGGEVESCSEGSVWKPYRVGADVLTSADGHTGHAVHAGQDPGELCSRAGQYDRPR